MNRRTFLQHSAALAAGTMTLPRGAEAAAGPALRRAATADNVVLLWMGGGMASTETFDPKPHVDFDPEMDLRRVLTTYPSIPSSLGGARVAQGLEEIASVLDRATLVRSFVPARGLDTLNEQVNHLPCQYLFHTGYRPPQTVAVPHVGSVISKLLGPRNPDIPGFINIGETSVSGAKAAGDSQNFTSSGFLGSAFGPLSIPDAARSGDVIAPLLKDWRFTNRHKAFRELVDTRYEEKDLSSFQRDSIVEAMENAYRLIKSPAAGAFDIEDELPEVRRAYDTGNFGRGCLLARRLVEAGSRFVEVHVAFDNAVGWDHHASGHVAVGSMKKLIDRPVAQLIRDLEQRGLLEHTLVILASEFSRTSINARDAKGGAVKGKTHFGLNNHHGGSGTCVFWGGGFQRGLLYGATANEFPCSVTEKPVFISDLHATIYTALGISPQHAFEIERRPFFVTEDGKGEPVEAWLA
jgi:uncharacterized protein (DUF1501 family)